MVCGWSKHRFKDCFKQSKIELSICNGTFNKKRPVWTGFKIAVRLKLLTHNNTRLFTAKKGNSKYYCYIMK